MIFSHVLYQLSYPATGCGTEAAAQRKGRRGARQSAVNPRQRSGTGQLYDRCRSPCADRQSGGGGRLTMRHSYHFTRNGMTSRATMLMTLIIGLMAGPAVSL